MTTLVPPTPWGVADTAEHIGLGVYLVTTPSHGGYYLPPAVNARVPAHWQAITWNNGQGREGWYEEDCDWALVALAVPELFIPEERTIARRIAEATHEKRLYRGAFEGY